MFTHVGDHVQVLPLEVAPVFFAERPNVANSMTFDRKWVLALIYCIYILNECIGVIRVQEGATGTLGVFSVVRIVANVDLVVLKESVAVILCLSERLPMSDKILLVQYCMDEDGLSEVKSHDEFISSKVDLLIVAFKACVLSQSRE